MSSLSRFVAVVAAMASLPLVAFTLVAAAYIAYSLLTQEWYRATFGAYGSRLLILYCLFAIGVGSAALLALRPAWGPSIRRKPLLRAAALAGFIAAALLEFTFWSDLGGHHAHGVLLLPFVGWVLFALSRRRA